MLHINPDSPFALTPDNDVPKSIRDNVYWDNDGDVLLVTKDGMVFLLRMNLLLQYSETIRSLLGHIAGVSQDGRWTPVLELECSATELRAVLEYLQLKEHKLKPSIDSLARCAFSAYTLGIKTLDDEALASLLQYTSDRLNAYAHWGGFAEFPAPKLNPVHAILAGRALPEPASSMLALAFVDLSVFATVTAGTAAGHGDEAASYPLNDDDDDDNGATTLTVASLRRPNDGETIALLRERHAEFVHALLRLAGTFGRRRALAKVGRPCCLFEDLAADREKSESHVNNNFTVVKYRCALSIIAAVGAQLEEARSRRQAPVQNASELQRAGQGCASCLAELHRGMMRLYGLWWEDVGRILMGEPEEGCCSVWDDVRSSLSSPLSDSPPNQWANGFERLVLQIRRTLITWWFLR